MKKLLFVTVMGCLLLMTGQTFAQCPNMVVAGKVVDHNSAPLSGVAVTVTGIHINNIVNGVSDGSGNYAVSFHITDTMSFTANVSWTKSGYLPVSISYYTCTTPVTSNIGMQPSGSAVPLTSKPVTWLIPVLLVGAGFFVYRKRRGTVSS